MIKNEYEVAVINYPLMDPRIKTNDFVRYFQMDYSSYDPWEVPIYIHIPFCTNICKFCIYTRQLPDERGYILQQYVEALKKEIRLYSSTPYIKTLKFGSVFIGGGTPTSLSAQQLKDIIQTLRDYLPIDDIEITVECNIIDCQEEKIGILDELGVKRISTGVQTFHDNYRSLLGMKTGAQEVYDWISMVRKYSFRDLSIDLLYGLPGQTCEDWIEDIKIGLSLPIDHFSIYRLAVFAYTRLYKEIQENLAPKLPTGEETLKMYEEAGRLLKGNGFYMQSSQEFCKKDRAARFWELTYDGYGDNLSLGSFSFGFINGINYQNHVKPTDYIQALDGGIFPISMVSEKITFEQSMERTMALGFRKSFVDKAAFFKQYGKHIDEVFSKELEALSSQGLIEGYNSGYRLTGLGEYFQGNVSAAFLNSLFRDVSRLKKKMAIGSHIVPDAL